MQRIGLRKLEVYKLNKIMKIAFYKWKWNLIDKLIRIWTNSPYSHCELVVDNWSMFSSSWLDGGVRVKYSYNKDMWDVYETNVYETDNIRLTMIKEIWKEYDYYWIFLSQIFPLNKQNPNKWFCSEICWYILWLDNPSQYNPGALYKILKNKWIIK